MAPRKNFAQLSREGDFRVTCYRDARHLGRRIGERDAAAYRAPVSNLVMCDVTYSFGQQRLGRRQTRMFFNVAPPHPRAKPHILGANFNSVEAQHIFQVDEKPGRGKAKRQNGHKTLPTRQHHGVAFFAKESDSIG
jgi:hypothetical protein